MENVQKKVTELTDRELMMFLSNTQKQIQELNVQHQVLQNEFQRRVNEGIPSEPTTDIQS